MPSVYYSDKTEIAELAAKKLKPEIDALKKGFRAASAKQQKQLDRIEAQLTELLAILKPADIDKPALVAKQGAARQP